MSKTLPELLTLAIEIITEERVSWLACNREANGRITDASVRALIRRFDSFLTPARETLIRIEKQQRTLRELKRLRESPRKPPRRAL